MTDSTSAVLDVLIMAAFPPELAPFRRLWGAAGTAVKAAPDEDEDAGVRARATVGALEIGGATVGIGLATSAVGACALLAESRPRVAVLVGTAGAYPGAVAGGLELEGVVVSAASRLVDRGTAAGDASLVASMADARRCDASLAKAFEALGATAVTVGTSLALTTSDAAAREIEAAFACGVEHLETHAVLTACARFGVPFVAVLGIANVVGSKGRAQWRAHQDEAAAAAASLVLRWIDAGAPGGAGDGSPRT